MNPAKLSGCTRCGEDDSALLCETGLCARCDAAAELRQLALRDSMLWDIACCGTGAAFWGRQGAYILLRERGYELPRMLPAPGDPMPPRRLRVVAMTVSPAAPSGTAGAEGGRP